MDFRTVGFQLVGSRWLGGSISLTAISIAFAFSPSVGQAQVVEWAEAAGGVSHDEGLGIAVDASGNVFVTGYYMQTATFGPFTHTNVAPADIFIAKYESTGQVAWVRSAGGPSLDMGYDLVVDPSGNVYVTGYFTNDATFGSIVLTDAGFQDMFLAKYDSSGNALWVRTAGEIENNDRGSGVALDSSGNIFVAGTFTGTANFGAFTLVSGAIDNFDVFLAKYDSDGNVLWARRAGGAGFDAGRGVGVDAAGNAYMTGHYFGTATFGGLTVVSATRNIFVAKYNSGGDVIWVRSSEGTSVAEGHDIAVDPSGKSFVTGRFVDTPTFGSVTLASSGGTDVLVAGLSSDGEVMWAHSAGGALDDIGVGIHIDAEGSSYLTGTYTDSAEFGATTLTGHPGSTDIFIAKYNAGGLLLEVETAGGQAVDNAWSIAAKNNGEVMVTGSFSETASFGPLQLVADGSEDVFVASYMTSGNIPTMSEWGMSVLLILVMIAGTLVLGQRAIGCVR